MKNFPHQINQIPRLIEGLQVIHEMNNSRVDVTDDGLLGDLLARSGVYRFRNRDGKSIDELLIIEHAKPRGQRGSRTCARDLRRLYSLLGFLDDKNELSVDAKKVVDMKDSPLNDESLAIWRKTLDQLEMSDDSGSSHPYRILLELVKCNPGITGAKLGLCLEAKDDSHEEFRRISELASRTSARSLWEEIGVSNSMVKNAIKILPSLAKQLGDILETDGDYHLAVEYMTDSGSDSEFLPPSPKELHNRKRKYSRGSRVRSATSEGDDRTHWTRTFDPDKTGERSNEHEKLLDRLSERVSGGLSQFEDQYDLTIVGPNKVLLIEAKTIRDDEIRQLRAGFSQLAYYEFFLVQPMYPDEEIGKLILTDKKPSEDLIQFLEHYGVGTVWIPTEGTAECSQLAKTVLDSLKISLEN